MITFFRLQVHLIVANLAVKKGKRDWNWKTKVVLWSKCRPMLELFRCNDLVKQENEWWYYEVDVKRLEQKVRINNEKDGKTDQVDSDDQCFRWCCLHQLLKTQNIHRLRNNLRKNNSALNGGGDLDYICK